MYTTCTSGTMYLRTHTWMNSSNCVFLGSHSHSPHLHSLYKRELPPPAILGILCSCLKCKNNWRSCLDKAPPSDTQGAYTGSLLFDGSTVSPAIVTRWMWRSPTKLFKTQCCVHVLSQIAMVLGVQWYRTLNRGSCMWRVKNSSKTLLSLGLNSTIRRVKCSLT